MRQGIDAVRLAFFAPQAPLVVSLMAAILIFRLHELVPPLQAIRPALLVTGVGTFFILSRTKPQALQEVAETPLLRLVLLQAGWALLTIPTSIWRGGSVQAWQTMLLNTILVAAILCVPPTPKSYRFVRNAFLGCAAVLAVALFAVGKLVAEDRFSVSYSLDPNDLAALFAMCVPFALGMAFSSDTPAKQRALGLLAAGLYLAAITRTGSRGGTVAVLVGLAVLFLYLPGRRKFTLAALGVPLLVGAFLFGPDSYRAKLRSLAQGQEDYNQTVYQGRVQVWKRGLRYVAQNPVLGVGMGNFTVQEGETMQAEGVRGSWTTAHNSYLQVAAELGVLGFAVLLAMLLTSLRIGHRAARGPARDAAIVAGVSGYMVAAFFLSHAYAYHLFGLLALVGLYSRSMLTDPAAGVGAPAFARARR